MNSSSSFPNGGGGGGVGGMLDFFKLQIISQSDNVMFTFFIMFMFEIFSGVIREFIVKLSQLARVWIDRYTDRMKERSDALLETVSTTLENKTNGDGGPSMKIKGKLTYSHSYGSAPKDRKSESILQHAMKVPEASCVESINGISIVVHREPFIIEKEMGIYFRIVEISYDEQKQKRESITGVRFMIYSYLTDIIGLQRWTEQMADAYETECKNNLGLRKYFFDQTYVGSDMPGGYGFDQCVFTMQPFNTNRTLENVFFEEDEEVAHRVRFFMNRKDWYDARGIPYTLGLLFHGAPGCGKTSTVKAIANETKRHIFNINLAAVNTKKKLKSLFYDEKVLIQENPNLAANTKQLVIPLDQRLYVIEDMDCLGDKFKFLRDRRNESPAPQIEEADDLDQGMEDWLVRETNQTKQKKKEEELDLSTILNVLDGTLETPGRILIITSNYPERLDAALIRPGRIDLLIKFKCVNHDVLKRMFENFYEEQVEKRQLLRIEEYKWTPAEIVQILFRNFYNSERAIEDLVYGTKSLFDNSD